MSFTRSRISPHLSPQVSPRRGYPPLVNRSVFTGLLSLFDRFAASPTSVGFTARAAGILGGAALAKNLPQRSRANEFTDGRVFTVKGHHVL